MKTYHGQRTARGCDVTVDGKPLSLRSNLSGNATTQFDWGYIGAGQLSLAILSDFFGSDAKAKAMSPGSGSSSATRPKARWSSRR